MNSSELSGYVNKNFDEKNAIVVKNSTFSWQKKINDNKDQKDCKTILTDINVEIEKNSFVAIVGSVGSGKSSLLSALLGDMEIQNGFVNMYLKIRKLYKIFFCNN